jgi:hypothetical protein
MSTHYKCTFSAITHKLNVFGHMLTWIGFHLLACGTRAQNSSAPFSYTLYNQGYQQVRPLPRPQHWLLQQYLCCGR